MNAGAPVAPGLAASPATGAVLLVVAGLACQEVGASIAVLLFPEVGPLGMVMLRLAFSAVVLLAIARPRLRGHGRAAWTAVVSFGLVLALMNGLFYLALERLPLGVTVTIEVLGPLALSIVAAGRARAFVWAGLALAGVVALAGGGWDRLDGLFDFTIFVGPPYAVLEERLRQRWQGYALPEDQIGWKLYGNDLPNGKRILENSRPADLHIDLF